MKKFAEYLTASCWLVSLCLFTGKTFALPLDTLNLPEGFTVSIFAEVENPRQMTRSDTGIIYVGSRSANKVHAVIDRDGDFTADEVVLVDKGMEWPTGVTWHQGTLYVGSIGTLLAYPDIDRQFRSSPEPQVISEAYPDKKHHGWKYLKAGPDGYLYVPVGAPCNICLSEEPVFASITRFNLADKTFEPWVHGVRNTVGFDWHPQTGRLWFTDNGRDMMGDDIPPCELNEVTAAGEHFGYPFFHGNSLPDPEFGAGKTAADYKEPALALGPHVAPLGMTFYRGNQFPAEYRQQVFIAEHGSWNRSPDAGHTGYRVTLARDDGRGKLRYEVFMDGWLQADNTAWGRPADVLELPDGSLLISDDRANVIYRVSYKK
ncbi:MAG: PQQ-dependent sugar dehydrogenase [Pseudomonadales bacterium]|nr:PQQ-dependent sugar dehydrogenase [Pseudomonadales bacterium]